MKFSKLFARRRNSTASAELYSKELSKVNEQLRCLDKEIKRYSKQLEEAGEKLKHLKKGSTDYKEWKSLYNETQSKLMELTSERNSLKEFREKIRAEQ